MDTENEIPDSTKIAMHPIILSATTAHIFAAGTFGKTNLVECSHEVMKQAKAVNKGDLTDVEQMLYGQAVALNTMFSEFARRAAIASGGNIESYMRLAFKAQAQCRATLQTLAEIKNPRPVAFVKQANISQGHQQINNGGVPPSPAHAQKTASPASSSENIFPLSRARAEN